MGADGKIYAELAALCDRNETARAIELANKETHAVPGTSVVLLALLQHAVVVEDVRVLRVLLGCTSRATCNLNAAISKDGKTLLHLAAAKRNLLVIRYLLDAGADLKAKDKKGVRVADAVTWTDVVYPAVACPLQNAVFKLELRNEALEKHTETLNDTARKTRYETENVELETAEVQAHFQASVEHEQTMKDQIEATKSRVEDAEDIIRNQGPRIAHIEQVVNRTKNTIADLVHQVDSTAAKTVAFRKDSERLRIRRAAQLEELSTTEKRSAVKCEVVETMNLFSSTVALEEKFVRSLTVMCQCVNVVKRLVMGGVQARLVDILLRNGGQSLDIFRHGLATITQLISMKAKNHQDHVLCTHLKPWPVSPLIPALAESLLLLATTTEEEPASLLGVFISFVDRLQDEPSQSDSTSEDFMTVVSAAANAIVSEPVLSKACTEPDIKAWLDKQTAAELRPMD